MNDHCEGCEADCFPDFIIPFEYWVQISPSGDEHGILCPNCICKRLHEKGLPEVPGAFMSGPIRSVSYDHMQLLRDLENLTLAISGRGNRYAVWLAERVIEAPAMLAEIPEDHPYRSKARCRMYIWAARI